MPQEGVEPMFNRYETVDNKGYLQGQYRELRGILRAVCPGGFGASPLPSRQAPHGRNKMTSRSIGHHWAGGFGQNWKTRFALSITQYVYLISRFQDSGCAGGYG
jgi:hypothetical protein